MASSTLIDVQQSFVPSSHWRMWYKTLLGNYSLPANGYNNFEKMLQECEQNVAACNRIAPTIEEAENACINRNVLSVAIHLIWMRFFEAYLPLNMATVGSILLAFVILWKG